MVIHFATVDGIENRANFIPELAKLGVSLVDGKLPFYEKYGVAQIDLAEESLPLVSKIRAIPGVLEVRPSREYKAC